MRLRIDLHIHSVHSGDSYIGIDDAIRRCREEELDGFAITDHDILTQVNSSKIDGTDLIVIPGIEVSSQGGHILALDVSEQIPRDLAVSETIDNIHEQDAIAIIAHPYSIFKSWINYKEISEGEFDAVEVANACQLPYDFMLKKNTSLAERMGLPQTGGSDAHIPRVIGRAFTVFEAKTRDVEGVLHALRKGNTEAVGRGITLAERLKLVKN